MSILLILAGDCCAAQNNSLEFVQPHYFMKHVVAAEYKTTFEQFYKNFTQNLKTIKPEQKARVLQEVRELACNNLAVKHPVWSNALKPYNYFERSNTKMLNAQECTQVRSFLTRYGVYEQFLKEQAQQHASFWHKVKSYSKNVGQQIVQWTGSIRRTIGA